jgi:hypothetical protein
MAQVATFAAGCFWSVELAFQRVPGVTKVGSLLVSELFISDSRLFHGLVAIGCLQGS